MIQNEEDERKEERNVEERLNEDAATAAAVGADSNLGEAAGSSASEIPPSLGAVAKRRSPRNKQKPSTDRLVRKPTIKIVRGSREGQEVCDFVRHLSQMELSHVLTAIFSHLSASDLCRVAQVSPALTSLSRHF